jgi:hypothetical protein
VAAGLTVTTQDRKEAQADQVSQSAATSMHIPKRRPRAGNWGDSPRPPHGSVPSVSHARADA